MKFLVHILISFFSVSLCILIHTMEKELNQFFYNKDSMTPLFSRSVLKYYPNTTHDDDIIEISDFSISSLNNNKNTALNNFGIACYYAHENLANFAQTAQITKHSLNSTDTKRITVSWSQDPLISSSDNNQAIKRVISASPLLLFFMGVIDRATRDVLDFAAREEQYEQELNSNDLMQRNEALQMICVKYTQLFNEPSLAKISASVSFTKQEQTAYTILKSLCNFNVPQYELERLRMITNRLIMMKKGIQATHRTLLNERLNLASQPLIHEEEISNYEEHSTHNY